MQSVADQVQAEFDRADRRLHELSADLREVMATVKRDLLDALDAQRLDLRTDNACTSARR